MRFQRLTTPALLLLATLAAFWPALAWDSQFVNFDDTIYITSPNSRVTHGINRRDVAWAFTTPYAENWHPLTWLSLMLDAQIYGQRPWGFHLTNVLLHAANVLLLYGILRAMTGSTWRSAAVAGLFAIHPLRAESVAWVTERKDVLSTCLGFIAVWAYVWYARAPERKWRYVPVFIAYALSLMAKPMLVTLPVLLLLLDFWPLRRWVSAEPAVGAGSAGSTAPKREARSRVEGPGASAGAAGPPFPRVPWQRLIIEKLPLLALALASSVVTFLIASHSTAMQTLTEMGVSERVCNVLVSYVRYLGKMAWPAKLAMFYPLPAHGSVPGAVAAAVALVAISVVAVWRRRAWPWLLVGWAWYVVALLPVIGVVHVGLQAIADRYTYIPGIGIALLAAWSIPERWGATPAGRVALGVPAAGLGVALILLTRVQVGHWHDSLALAQHTLDVTHDNWVAEKNLANALNDQGQTSQALYHLRRALAIKPDLYGVYFDLGAIYASHHQPDQAIANYLQAIKLHAGTAQIHINLANVYFLQGRLTEAEQSYRRALTLDPQSAEAHNNLGVLLGQRGDHAGELAEYEAAAVADPDFLMGRFNLGKALLDRGQAALAIVEFKAVLGLEPDPQKARQAENGLKLARAMQGMSP